LALDVLPGLQFRFGYHFLSEQFRFSPFPLSDVFLFWRLCFPHLSSVYFWLSFIVSVGLAWFCEMFLIKRIVRAIFLFLFSYIYICTLASLQIHYCNTFYMQAFFFCIYCKVLFSLLLNTLSSLSLTMHMHIT